VSREYVGIDLHRRRSVIVRLNEAGETLSTVSIDNDPVALALEVAKAGPDPEVVLEATYGWYWAADVLEAAGAQVQLQILRIELTVGSEESPRDDRSVTGGFDLEFDSKVRLVFPDRAQATVSGLFW
jgi:hypothetical protein